MAGATKLENHCTFKISRERLSITILETRHSKHLPASCWRCSHHFRDDSFIFCLWFQRHSNITSIHTIMSQLLEVRHYTASCVFGGGSGSPSRRALFSSSSSTSCPCWTASL